MKLGDSAILNFEMQYQWHIVKGHDPVNAIIENGSFMRISRCYPTALEISDSDLRKKMGIGIGLNFKGTGRFHLSLTGSYYSGYVDFYIK